MLTGLTFGNVRFTEVVDCRDEFPEAAEAPCRRRHEMWQEQGIFSRVWPDFTYIIVLFFAYNGLLQVWLDPETRLPTPTLARTPASSSRMVS